MRKKPIKEKWRHELIDCLRHLKGEEAIDEFLKDLLTENEYREVILRIQIIKLLAEGRTHRYISRELGVGVATIERGVKELANPKGAFAKIFGHK